jgi:hypothetical protein
MTACHNCRNLSLSTNSLPAFVCRQPKKGYTVNNPVSSQPRRQTSHRRRLALHVTIGMFMVAVAAAGYMFFGPGSGTAIGDHDRPADIATSLTVAPPIIATTVSANDFAPAHNDLDSMRAEMKAITDQVNAILEQLQPQAEIAPANTPIQSNGAVRMQAEGGE